MYTLKISVWRGVLSTCQLTLKHRAPKQRHRPPRAHPATFWNLSIHLSVKEITVLLTELGWQAHDRSPLLDQIHQKLSQRPQRDQRFSQRVPAKQKLPPNLLQSCLGYALGEHINDKFKQKHLLTRIARQR